jgi:phenylacetic acid degradation operon negative regulatory protein
MQPKTEEFLNFLLWSAEQLMRPSLRNVGESYESWAYRKGLMRTVTTLERRRFVERDPSGQDDRVVRLTGRGRLHALGGRDPQAEWSREWDGKWRLVLFDIPNSQNNRRQKLRRYLRDRGFGCLQNSVWIRPDSLEPERKALAGGHINVESLILMEARPSAGETDEDIVAGAWDFAAINRRYERHLEILNKWPAGPLKPETAANALLHWAKAEREAWLAAVNADPLLPETILPENYLGRTAWRKRVEVLKAAGRQIRTFKP